MKRNLFAALAITALAAAGTPGAASASTTAGTTILNVVTVDYTDITKTNSFSAAFSTTVTVNLVQAPLSITTPPSDLNLPGFLCAGTGSYPSGGTFSALYALTAAANGQDTYKIGVSSTPDPTTASSSSATYTMLNSSGTPLAGLIPGERILNSAIVVGTFGSDTLLFPGGSLKGAGDNGLAAGDIVVVDYGATKTAYLVKTVTLGNAAGYSVNGDTASTSTGLATPESRDAVQVEAFANNVLGIGNGNNQPDFENTAPPVGTIVGQMALVKIEVTAVSSSKDEDATADYQLTTTDSDGDNTQYVGSATNTPANTCLAGNFLATRLEILKQVRNLTKGAAAFTATATGDPGDVLEYLITVNNEGGQANSTTVSDNIPSYTTLVTYADNYGAGAADNTTGYFAQVSDGVNTVNITVDANSEAQPAASAPSVGFGKAAGVIAGLALNFYLGHGSSSSAGGTVPSCSDSALNTQALCVVPETWNKTYTIMYRVKVD